MTIRRSIVVLIALWLVAPVTLLPAQSLLKPIAHFSSVAQDQGQDVATELARIREQWVKQLHSKQLDQILTWYAPDAVFLQPGGARITGQTAIHDLFKNIMQSVNSDLNLHSITTEVSGTLAYDSGDYRETITTIPAGTRFDLQGNYLIVFKRQADGRWLIVEHVWTGIEPAIQ
jgi:ketosteroid isomerase-like protein